MTERTDRPAPGRLAGKVALVTGAAGGIGLGIARRFHAEGASVVLADRDEKVAEALASLAQPARARAVRADVTRAADVARMVGTCVEAFGGLDCCVCNAGVIRAGSLLDVTEDDLAYTLGVNVTGTVMVAQAAARVMIDGGRRGSLITLSSMTAEVAMPDQLAYGASKGAVRQITKSMALALAPYGIRVNALGPGSIETDIMKTITDEPGALRTVLSRTPMGRLGLPDEVAGAALFLASDDASYVTGHTLYVDGGRLALNYTVPAPD